MVVLSFVKSDDARSIMIDSEDDLATVTADPYSFHMLVPPFAGNLFSRTLQRKQYVALCYSSMTHFHIACLPAHSSNRKSH